MKVDCPGMSAASGRQSIIYLLAAMALMAGCAQMPEPVRSEPPQAPAARGAQALLAYYQALGRLNAAELAKERSSLPAQPTSPSTQIRLAMVLGHPRGPQETERALALVQQVLKSQAPATLELHPLARLLADSYSERLRLEGQFERQSQQLKDSQRKTQELQDKLDGLADIERTLTPRPGAGQGGKP